MSILIVFQFNVGNKRIIMWEQKTEGKIEFLTFLVY